MALGGGMVKSVTDTGHVLERTPMSLEAGTAHFEGVIGLAAACSYLEQLGFDNILEHERCLTEKLVSDLLTLPRVTVLGPQLASQRGAIVAFSIEGLEAHGAARICCRTERTCAYEVVSLRTASA